MNRWLVVIAVFENRYLKPIRVLWHWLVSKQSSRRVAQPHTYYV